MMRVKNVFVIILMFLLLITLVGVESTSYGITESEVTMLKPEEFAIIPWGWTTGDLEVLKEIKECGFNVAGFVAPDAVALVKEAGLKCIVHDSGMASSLLSESLTEAERLDCVKKAVTPFLNDETVWGYYLLDEPHSGLFPILAKWAGAVKSVDPKALSYINLFPNYASGAQLQVKDYDEYLEKFVQTVDPSFLSYDHYALMDDGSLRHGYFQNLEAVRRSSLKHDIPFWNIVLGNAHFSYAVPTPGGLRFQAFTTLAYGARGLSYFTYFAPMTGNYRNAPLDQFGQKTATWDMMRNVNMQIHKIGPTYIQLKSVNVFHHPEVPEGCSGIETSKHVAEISGGSFVVGEFEAQDGSPYAMVVNKDFHKSTAFNISFKQPGAIRMTNPYNGQVANWAGENNWLAPGQGMLLHLSNP